VTTTGTQIYYDKVTLGIDATFQRHVPCTVRKFGQRHGAGVQGLTEREWIDDIQWRRCDSMKLKF